MWYKLPVKKRLELMKTYRDGGYSYNDMVKDYNDSFESYKQSGPVAEPLPENNNGMVGMMKSRMAIASHFENPSAQRMTSPNPKTGITPEGQGTHYMASMDNYAVPHLQDKGGRNLEFIDNPTPSNEDIRFNREQDARYFAKNYKQVAPMMRKYSGGGVAKLHDYNYNDAYKKFAQGGVQPAIDNSLIKSQYNRSETVNQPVNDIYKKRYINTDPDIIGSKYWDYRDPKKDSSVENALEYVPVIGNMLSVNDMMDAQRSFYNNPNRSTATSAALETLGMYPMGKGFGKAKQFMVDAAVQGSSDIAEYTGDKKTKSK